MRKASAAPAPARVRLILDECGCGVVVAVDQALARTGAVLGCPSCDMAYEIVDVTGTPVAVPVEDDEPEAGASMPEARTSHPSKNAYATSTPAPAPVPAPELPGSWAVRGAHGRWRCGHTFTIPTNVDDTRPERVSCPTCGTRGLLAQHTPQGWAPVLARR